MSTRARQAISIATLSIFAAWALWFVDAHPEIVGRLGAVQLHYVVGLYMLTVLMFAANGLYTRTAVGAHGVHLGHAEAFLLGAGTTAANYLLPARGGAGIRAAYLRGHHHFPIADFMSTLSALYLLFFTVNGAAGIVGMALLWAAGRAFDPLLGSLFAIVAAVAAGLVLYPPSLSESARFPLGFAARIVNGWGVLRRHPVALQRLFAITLTSTCLLVLQTLIAFEACGVALPIADALFFAAAKSLFLLATITPGALGIVEWLSVYMAGTLAFTPQEGLLAQSLMRAITITTAFAIAPFAIHRLGIRFRDPGSSSEAPRDE